MTIEWQIGFPEKSSTLVTSSYYGICISIVEILKSKEEEKEEEQKRKLKEKKVLFGTSFLFIEGLWQRKSGHPLGSFWVDLANGSAVTAAASSIAAAHALDGAAARKSFTTFTARKLAANDPIEPPFSSTHRGYLKLASQMWVLSFWGGYIFVTFLRFFVKLVDTWNFTFGYSLGKGLCANLKVLFFVPSLMCSFLCTVTGIWNWKNSTVLGLFVTQKFCLHELWNQLSFKMCSKASLTHRLWEI